MGGLGELEDRALGGFECGIKRSEILGRTELEEG